MILLSAVIFLMFLSVKHAFVISTIGSNVTINLTVPKKGSTSVSLKNGSMLFATDIHKSPNVTVFKNDRISNVSYQSGGNVQFILHNITEEDAGNYVCLDDKRDVIPDCGEWLIVSQNPATPVIQKKSMPIKDGSLALSCYSSSRSLPENHNLTMIFSWKKNDEILSSTTTTDINGSDIRVNHLSRSNNGDNFSCQAEEILGLKSEWSRPFMLILEYGPEDIHIDPNQDTITVNEGVTTEVRCFADCKPDCIVVWWDRDRQKVINSGVGNSILNIIDASRNTSGQFSCMGHNRQGIKSKNIEVNIIFNMSFIEWPADEEADARDNDGLKEEGDVKGVVSVIDVQVLLSIVMTALAVMIVVSVIFGVKYKKMKEKSGKERYAAYLTPLSNRESDERNANDDNNGYATIKDDGDGYATIKDDNNVYVTINDDNNGYATIKDDNNGYVTINDNNK